jgi:hypothetical protein
MCTNADRSRLHESVIGERQLIYSAIGAHPFVAMRPRDFAAVARDANFASDEKQRGT